MNSSIKEPTALETLERPSDADPRQLACADRILETVPRAMRRIRAETRTASRPRLSVPQVRALLFVRHHPGSGLTPLVEHLGVSLPAGSALVDRLVRAGLLHRAVDPAERRRIALRLTETGAEQVALARLATRQALLVQLSALTPGEIERLGEGLDLLDRVVGSPEPGP